MPAIGRSWIGVALIAALLPPWAAADTPELPGGTRPKLEDFAPEPEPTRLDVLPPAPTPRAAERGRLSSGLRAVVSRFRFEGNTVFDSDDLATVTAPWTGRAIGAEDLHLAAEAVTRKYVKRGYVSSGARIPDQDVVDGVVTIQVDEGRVIEVAISGNRFFRTSYLRSRIARALGPPVNVFALEEALQLLQQDPRIRRVDAELQPSLRRGQGVLALHVEDERGLDLWAGAGNDRSPAVGSEGGELGVRYGNLLGVGDSLELVAGLTEGYGSQRVDYRIPLNGADTSLSLHYRHSESDIVENPFDELDIESKLDTYRVALVHPLYWTRTSRLDLGLAAEHRRSKTSFLGGRAFFPVPGSDRSGAVHVSVLRLFQEWTRRTRDDVIAARSSLSWGVDLLDASVEAEPDGKFVAWLLQLQWLRRLPALGDSHLLMRTDFQWAGDTLPSVEQFALGGIHTVRGYRENTFVRDNGWVSSVELRVPVLRDWMGTSRLEIAPFFDVGKSWSEAREERVQTLASLGIGLRYSMRRGLSAWAYWGGRLRDVPRTGNDIQNNGFHLGASLEY